mgnify:CR=1 FL=1
MLKEGELALEFPTSNHTGKGSILRPQGQKGSGCGFSHLPAAVIERATATGIVTTIRTLLIVGLREYFSPKM